MSIPGFTAEASVYRTTESYRTIPSGSLSLTGQSIAPQLDCSSKCTAEYTACLFGCALTGGACVPGCFATFVACEDGCGGSGGGGGGGARAKSALRLSAGNSMPRRMRQGAGRGPHLQRGLR
jgi:hypothetical protein